MPEAKKYRKLPVVIEATQWFRNGDHPLDNATEMFDYPDGSRPQVIREGEIVRYFRHPERPGDSACEHENCVAAMHDHGWIDTLEGGHIVCPGDFIITGVKGERYPCKPDIFALTYEIADEPELSLVPVGLPYEYEVGRIIREAVEHDSEKMRFYLRPSVGQLAQDIVCYVASNNLRP